MYCYLVKRGARTDCLEAEGRIEVMSIFEKIACGLSLCLLSVGMFFAASCAALQDVDWHDLVPDPQEEEPSPLPPTDPPPVVVPPSPVDSEISCSWNMGGRNWRNAKRDPAVTLSNVHATRNRITYNVTNYNHWQLGSEPGCNAGAVMFNRETGDGGFFDHARANTRERDWNNLNTRYNGWVRPSSGTPMMFVIYSADGKLRSNPVRFIFP
jgi:hypothetical protein